ncbi:hypothetical protein ACLB2K_063640 [Fragaria x ananassa]
MKHKRKSRNGEVDRFSKLPKEILHHILSRLVIRDLARFCCVSSTCKELALSAPSVSIGGYNCGFDIDEMPCELRLKLVNALDRFLLSRGDNKMQKFSLSWQGHCEDEMEEPPCFCVNESFRMMTWIKNAVRCNVEKLSVNMTFYEPDGELLPYPCCVFKCASLRSLKVEMSFAVLKTPSFSFSSNLETLELSDVDIADEGFFKWISCSCKLLKKLILARINGINIITIESSCLEDFFYIHYEVLKTSYLNISGEKIEKINIDCRYSPRSTMLNIIAPKVKYLMLEGNVKNNLNFGDLDCLQEASIIMEPIVDEFHKASEVLSSLCSVEVLILNEAIIKAAYREEHMRAQLDKIWCLRINIGSFADDLVPAVVSLLRGTPNLCTLYMCYEPTSLDPKSNTSAFNKKYWKKQNLDFISQVVTIELSAGPNGIEFARYVLEHAKSLEKMVIRYLTRESCVKKKLRKSCMISNAAVTFKKYRASVDPLIHY